jgi:hypothetical protein
MGRKKRKVEVVTPSLGDTQESLTITPAASKGEYDPDDPHEDNEDAHMSEYHHRRVMKQDDTADDDDDDDDLFGDSPTAADDDTTTNDIPAASMKADPNDSNTQNKVSSGYAMTSHSGDILGEDIYVSDGSEDEDDELEILLSGSRMGLMRRGLVPYLSQPNRQWVRAETTDTETNPELSEQDRLLQEQEELAKLDPAQRAARLLQEKQRKMELAKETARRVEAEENAGRDATLFSKRTAFDIRLDQMDDKPWTRGGDLPDFFNYGLTEEDWMEYAEQQLMIRQELMDANRQKRQPDPNIVPVVPRTPRSQQPRVAVASSNTSGIGGGSHDEGDDDHLEASLEPALGPSLPEATPATVKIEPAAVEEPLVKAMPVIPAGIGGAWGAGAEPGSFLAKLIEEQEDAEMNMSEHASEPDVTDARHVRRDDRIRSHDASLDYYGNVAVGSNEHTGSVGGSSVDYYGGSGGGREVTGADFNYYGGGAGGGGRGGWDSTSSGGFRGRGFSRGRGRGGRGGRGFPPPPPQHDIYGGGGGSYNREPYRDDTRWRR